MERIQCRGISLRSYPQIQDPLTYNTTLLLLFFSSTVYGYLKLDKLTDDNFPFQSS